MAKKKEKVFCDERLKHIAFIMDGNGRWATSKLLPRTVGHVAGAKAFRRIADYCDTIGLQHVTFYAFSTENWTRPQEEIDQIMKLLSEYIDEAIRVVDERNFHLKFIGDKSRFTGELRERMDYIENRSAKNTKMLNIALNYGSRDEIVHAVNQLIKQGKTEVTEKDICDNLYTAASPDPDLIIRTANEQRLSNFLLWQAAYSEFYFTKKLWPDLTENDIDDSIREFYSRKRKFGGVK